MKTLVRNLIDVLAEAAMLEEGVRLDLPRVAVCDPRSESLEENMIEVDSVVVQS